MVEIAFLASWAYVLWRPVSAGSVLYPTLAVAMLMSVVMIVRERLATNPRFALAAFLLLLVAAMGSFIGSMRSTPGLTQQASQWFGSITLWFIFASSFTLGLARKALWLLTLATIVISGLIVLYVGSQRGVLPAVLPTWVINAQGAGYDFTDSGTAIRWFGLSTLVAAGPTLAAAAVLGRDALLPSRRLTVIAAVAAGAASVLAGRRALLVVLVLAPIVALILRAVLDGRAIRPRGYAWTLVAPAVLAGSMFFAFTRAAVRIWQAMQDVAFTYFHIGSGSGTAKSADDLTRTEQASRLIDGLGNSPVFGNGLGADVPGYVRSDSRPWNFELQYNMLLFDTGFVGFILVVAAFWVGASQIRRIVRAQPEYLPSIVATTVGALSMLLGNASNPYLQAVGHGWSIALPVGVCLAVWRSQLPRQSGTRDVDEAIANLPPRETDTSGLVSPGAR